MTRRLALAAAVAAILLAPSLATPARAGTVVTVGVSPARVELRVSASGDAGPASITLRLAGGAAPLRVTVELADAALDASGRWSAVPAGSTAYSLAASLTVEPAELTYTPGPTEQRFTMVLRYHGDASMPRAGVLAIVATPASSTSGVAIAGRIEVPVVAYPATSSLADLPAIHPLLEDRGAGVAGPAEPSALDGLVGLVARLAPWLVEPGDLQVSAAYANAGDAVLDTSTAVLLESIDPVAALTGSAAPGSVLRRASLPSRYALPGQAYTDTFDATAADATDPADPTVALAPLPWLGLVRVTATTTGTLGPIAAAPLVRSRVVLVAPWKGALGLLLVLLAGLLVLALRRRRRRARDRRDGWTTYAKGG